MNGAERYVREVLRHVPVILPEQRARIADDVRGHLAESVEAGESEAGAVRRMGAAEQTAAAFLEPVRLPPAPLPDRVGAFLFDQALAATPVIAALALAGMHDARTLAALDDPATTGTRLAAALLVAGTIAVSMLYFPVLEARSGQTPGKRLFGIAVVRASGTAVRLGGAVIRRLPSLFSFALLDALFAPFTARRQRAFDLVAGTVVVRAPRAPRRARAWMATAALLAVAAAAAAALLSVAPGGAGSTRAGGHDAAPAIHPPRG